MGLGDAGALEPVAEERGIPATDDDGVSSLQRRQPRLARQVGDRRELKDGDVVQPVETRAATVAAVVLAVAGTLAYAVLDSRR